MLRRLAAVAALLATSFSPVIAGEACVTCHEDVQKAVAKSVHGRHDKQPGDHPTCAACHGDDPHATDAPPKLSRRQQAVLCSSCHRERALMGRYDVDPDAVSSYEQSFHGKKLLRFYKNGSGHGFGGLRPLWLPRHRDRGPHGRRPPPFRRAEPAACTDCHGHHDIHVFGLCPAPADRALLERTCGSCHPGAQMNFCMSGANHLRLKIESSPILRLEDIFFRALTYATIALLMGMIGLDLRRKVFCIQCRPRAGRLVAGFIAIGFAALAAGLVISLVGAHGAEWAWVAATGAMAVAFFLYLVRTRPTLAPKPERLYQRFTPSLRAQHICLAVSFTVLVVTGMPLRFAHVGWSHHLQLLFGGLEGARVAHRAAAVLMTATWLWHFGFLLCRWKRAGFSLRSWTMMPTRKDFSDFADTIRYGLGLRHERPRYGRFQWREKFDYLAVYWGMPIMVFSGAVLWWPVFWGNRLTDLGLGIAYIAHSDEAILALLAIAIWHLYNTHLDPEHFPMNPVWYSGVLTESEMEREHPIEKAKVDETM